MAKTTKNQRVNKIQVQPKSKKIAKSKNTLDISELYKKVHSILEHAKNSVVRKVNVEMVRAYWFIGEAIVAYEQKGKERAGYGERVIESLAEQLTKELGKGFISRNLWWMREFHLNFPKLNAVRSELSWTHYRLLLKEN